MAKAARHGKMEAFIKETGWMARCLDMEYFNSLMEMSTLVNLKTIVLMVRVSMSKRKVIFTRDSG